MNRLHICPSVLLILISAAATMLATGVQAVRAEARKTPPPLPTAEQLPAIPQLPDPFLLADGSRVKSPADWERRRAEIRTLILDYEYGHPGPDPKNVTAQEQASKSDEATGATHKTLLLTMGPGGRVSTTVELTLPGGKGPWPVIVKGDLIAHDPVWETKAPIVAEVVKRGYALALFDRTQIAPDDKTRDKGVLAAYPDADQGDLAAWAWGFSRVIDYLVTRDDIDKDKIIVTGHSRGGKAALLAGALDERVALTVPNGSGAGGCGCYRVQPPKTEDLKAIVTRFPNWFGPNFAQFIDHVDHLPFDQHEVRALVAPRALLDTEGEGDVWANAHGTQASYLAAKEVYKFLGVPEKIGIHFRPGKHDQNAEDWAALLDFADRVLMNKPATRNFDKLPFPEDPKAFEWAAPTK